MTAGGPEAWWMNLRDQTDTSNMIVMVINPDANSIVGWDNTSTWGRVDGGTGSFAAWTLGSNLTVNSGVINAILPTRSYNNTPSRSIVTGTGATGFQISSTRDALANYSVTITSAVQIGLVSNVDGVVVLEICATNSATPGDWIEVARTPQAQNIGLAIALASTQKGGGNLTTMVPAGWFIKIRSINIAGTPTYAYNSGQEVLF